LASTGEAAAKRQEKRDRASAAAEAEREALVKHLEEQDARLNRSRMHKEALMAKRQADAWDPTPARRVMYDDKMCAQKAEIPGPAEYSPRLMVKDSEAGKTFGASPFMHNSSQTASQMSSLPDRDAGSLDAYRVKVASQMPGPASYSPRLTGNRGLGGSTFGLPPELRHGKVVPDAHDMSRMVTHLRDLPAPDAYSPLDPMAKNKGFRMVQPLNSGRSSSSTRGEMVVPGPGTYNLSSGLSAGRATVLRGGGKVKSELDMEMDRARDLPGPGAYDHASSLRSKGSPRFSKAGGNSLIEAIQVEARKKPGPDAYFPQATFAQELEMQRYKRDVIAGLIAMQ